MLVSAIKDPKIIKTIGSPFTLILLYSFLGLAAVIMIAALSYFSYLIFK